MARSRHQVMVNDHQLSLFTSDATGEAVLPQQILPQPEPGSMVISQVIVHGLKKSDTTPELSDACVILDERAHAFFAQHVENASRVADWNARFLNPEGEVPALCHQILSGESGFVQASRILAGRLHGKMRTRGKAKSGNLAIITYMVEGASSEQIAMLKLDPDQSRLSLSFSKEGNVKRATVKEAENLLPIDNDLQKCAIVTPEPGGADFAVRLMDAQVRSPSEDAAEYFYRGFLDTDLAPSSRRYTRNFLHFTGSWLEQGTNAGALKPSELMHFYQTRREVLSASRVDVADFASQALPSHPQMQASLTAFVTTALADGVDRLPVKSFVVHRAIADQYAGTVILKLEGKARLRIPLEAFDELVSVSPERSGDGKYVLTIRSLQLSEGY